jgi:hypothetical protein
MRAVFPNGGMQDLNNEGAVTYVGKVGKVSLTYKTALIILTKSKSNFLVKIIRGEVDSE